MNVQTSNAKGFEGQNLVNDSTVSYFCKNQFDVIIERIIFYSLIVKAVRNKISLTTYKRLNIRISLRNLSHVKEIKLVWSFFCNSNSNILYIHLLDSAFKIVIAAATTFSAWKWTVIQHSYFFNIVLFKNNFTYFLMNSQKSVFLRFGQEIVI